MPRLNRSEVPTTLTTGVMAASVQFDDSPSARYCPHDMVGYQDLDDNGDWRPSSQYGNVWYPRVDANWSPYHEGHWAWIDPWGWTWVDDERWGYAPFHYGRWVSDGGRWGWIPGPREQRAVYAPALVAFVGGVGIGVGGNVAWFPLGPREVYVPTYQVSPGVCKSCQHLEHHRQHHYRHECLQHNHRQ